MKRKPTKQQDDVARGLRPPGDAQCDCQSRQEVVRLRFERIHDLNQIGGLQQENRLLTQLLDELDEAIYFFDCNSDGAKCDRRIDSIVNRYRKHKEGEQ
jgi:hypothetical protein